MFACQFEETKVCHTSVFHNALELGRPHENLCDQLFSVKYIKNFFRNTNYWWTLLIGQNVFYFFLLYYFHKINEATFHFDRKSDI